MIEEQSADLGTIRLNYASGPKNGPPLALFHGVTRRWQSFLPIWTTLASRWQLLAWDARGHGLSSRAADSHYQVVDYVADAVTFVSQTFKQPGVLYGHSLGAMVALATAAAVPEHVRAVVLEDPPFNTMGTRIDETPLLSFFSGLVPFAGHHLSIAAVARDLAEVRITVPGKDQSVRLGDTRDATALRFTARSLADLDPEVLQSIISGHWMAGYDFNSILAKVQLPVLLLQADANYGAMLTDSDVNLLMQTLPDCTLARFPNAPHLIHWSQPESLLRQVLGFLESLT
ncbi:MAG: ydjP 2 [Planctomycetaceae bacterium]|nr:ydjP 2 [Planctomycetaceae bacterium]